MLCADAQPVVSSVTTEPVEGTPGSLTLAAAISNTGRAALPAGVTVGFADGDTPIGSVATTLALATGQTQVVSLPWTPDGAHDHPITVTPGTPEGVTLCRAPAAAQYIVAVRDLPLAAAWSLVSSDAAPADGEINVMRRGIAGSYTAILGFDGTMTGYDPSQPDGGTLRSVDARHGYWVKTVWPADVTPEEIEEAQAAGTWRWSGAVQPGDAPLPLVAGQNLVSYLPPTSQPVTVALQSIDGRYLSVLGFAGAAQSFYPDIDPGFNTLHDMTPGMGYWIARAGR